MKHLKLFEEVNIDSVKNDINKYVSGFYIDRDKSNSKKFINDSTGKLVVEVAYRSKYGYTRFRYFTKHINDKSIDKKELEPIVLNALKQKFPNIQISGIIFEDPEIDELESEYAGKIIDLFKQFK